MATTSRSDGMVMSPFAGEATCSLYSIISSHCCGISLSYHGEDGAVFSRTSIGSLQSGHSGRTLMSRPQRGVWVHYLSLEVLESW